MNHRRITRLVVTMTIAGAVLIPAPIAGGAVSPCSVLPNTTTDNDIQVSTSTRMVCTGTGRAIDRIRVRIQEQFGAIIHTRADTTFIYTDTPLDVTTPTVSANCAGHGVDNWRNNSTGTDTFGDTRTTATSWKSHNCP